MTQDSRKPERDEQAPAAQQPPHGQQGPNADAGKGPPANAVPKGRQNDRAAHNQSGMGSNPSARDMTSGRHSGNQ